VGGRSPPPVKGGGGGGQGVRAGGLRPPPKQQNTKRSRRGSNGHFERPSEAEQATAAISSAPARPRRGQEAGATHSQCFFLKMNTNKLFKSRPQSPDTVPEAPKRWLQSNKNTAGDAESTTKRGECRERPLGFFFGQ